MPLVNGSSLLAAQAYGSQIRSGPPALARPAGTPEGSRAQTPAFSVELSKAAQEAVAASKDRAPVPSSDNTALPSGNDVNRTPQREAPQSEAPQSEAPQREAPQREAPMASTRHEAPARPGAMLNMSV